MPQVKAINMLILKLKKCKSEYKEIKEIIEIYMKKEEFEELACPQCGSDELIKWGSYKRIIYYLDNQKIKYKNIEIKRIKCRKCNKTHALLPEYIVPYKQALLDIILLSIDNNEIAYGLSFSYETIENWKKIYKRRYLPYLKTMFKNIQEIISRILKDIFRVYEEFYEENKKILMMNHRGIINMAFF